MNINEKIFTQVYSVFKTIVESNTNEKLVDFKTNNYVDYHENYKYEILKEAKDNLLTKTWKAHEIGKGRIFESIKKSIKTKVYYNFRTIDNNLIDWRKKDNFNNLEANKENEKLFFDFFKSKIKDEVAFEKFNKLGFSYQLIAYLFFVKNPQKYMPISQERFDEIFDSIGINLKTSNNISWDNYLEFNEIINSFKNNLKIKFENISLLDAHSFLWIYGFQFVKDKEKIEKTKPTKIKNKNNTPEQKGEKSTKELETYQPKKGIEYDESSDDNNQNEIDYLEQHKKMIELGNLAEERVLEDEINFLIEDYPELAQKVHSVAKKSHLGFDIVSYETDGTQKQIEVKAISSKNKNKSFIITRNEINKSKEYNNYYIYCVSDVKSENPPIKRIKNPDLQNKYDFRVEPLTYKVTFQ